MEYRAFLLAAGLLLAGPALADDQGSRLAGFLMLVAGIGDGATVNVGHGAVSPVTRLGLGKYEVVLDRTGATIDFQASESARCVLDLNVTIAGQLTGGGMRLDLNHVNGMDIHLLPGEVPSHVFASTGDPYTGPLNGIAVVIKGADDALEASTDGLNFTPMTPHATFLTSLTVKDLQAAFDTLHSDCPVSGN